MNKTSVAQQAKTSSFFPLAKGVLQRKCTCGNHTGAGGECAECAKNRIGLQRKLAFGASNDPLELEADRIADQVISTPACSAVSGAPPRIPRFAERGIDGMDKAPGSVNSVLASQSRSLEPLLRQDMEQHFGHDFSQVCVHTGGAAEQSARDVSANAYTMGHNIVFGAGHFTPGTDGGRRLLAHELTHVMQQSGANGLHGGQGNGKNVLPQISVRRHRDESSSNALPDVHRSIIHRSERGSGRTNRKFDTFAITDRDLSDPDIIARLNALSKVGLIEYRRQVKDLAVIEYITNLINQMPALPPCTAEEAKETSNQAEAARATSLPFVASAVKALGSVANNSLLCAFASNFNTTGDAPEFQTRRLIVGRRLAALASKMKTVVPFACVPADDPVCMKPGKADTVAYVVDHKPPIKFCPSFRGLVDDMTGLQQAIVIHEYAHLVGGIDDSGGYASTGAQIGTCTVNSKFKAQGDVLINTADALTGFVMHIGLGLTPPATTPVSTGTAAVTEEQKTVGMII